MLKIIKCGAEYNLPRSSVVKVEPTYDGILVTLRDGTEVRYTMSVSPQIKAMMPIVQNSKARIVKLDLDAAMLGRYDRVVTLINEEPKPTPPVIVIQAPATPPTEPPKITEPPKETKPVQKKKGGRPKGSKSKKTSA